MRGKVYGVGTGPGDPELMTFKAARVIREADVVAVPSTKPREALAYRIAVQAVPELAEKELLPIDMPMIKDRELIRKSHREGAAAIAERLDAGENVAFITIGDPTVYCTFAYLQEILEEDGYDVELVSGITSFCAAAAAMNVQICKWNEPLHVIPASHKTDAVLDQPGTYVLMKSASYMRETKDILRASGRSVAMVENCGLPDQRIYRDVEDIPDDASYFSLIIARED